jgi:hypothetical protein
MREGLLGLRSDKADCECRDPALYGHVDEIYVVNGQWKWKSVQ